uniref:Uncharacterized protein n=1 Tax=Timema douglasi TaxID=61478 RepID=A0A7R8VTQ7_TIMDO|nr:unnamed protein product [Timema douglasi]
MSTELPRPGSRPLEEGMEGKVGSRGTNPPPLTQCCDCSQCAQSNMETSFLRLVLLLVLFFLLTGDYTSIFGQVYQLLGGEEPPSDRVAVKKTRDASKVPPTGDDADATLQILYASNPTRTAAENHTDTQEKVQVHNSSCLGVKKAVTIRALHDNGEKPVFFKSCVLSSLLHARASS